MKTLAAALLVAVCLPQALVLAKPSILYVATTGNDSWSGHLEKPSASGRDGPLATLPAALKAARVVRQYSGTTAGTITILLRGGTYRLAEPVVLTSEDSGVSEKLPLTIAA